MDSAIFRHRPTRFGGVLRLPNSRMFERRAYILNCLLATSSSVGDLGRIHIKLFNDQ